MNLINKRKFPDARTSPTTFRIRSSNSPRYLLPATIPDRSKDHNPLILHRFRNHAGDDLLGKPFHNGSLAHTSALHQARVVLGRRERIWIRRLICSSLPITGSSFPSAASAVKSRLYWSSTERCRPSFFSGRLQLLADFSPSIPSGRQHTCIQLLDIPPSVIKSGCHTVCLFEHREQQMLFLSEPARKPSASAAAFSMIFCACSPLAFLKTFFIPRRCDSLSISFQELLLFHSSGRTLPKPARQFLNGSPSVP